MVSLFIVSYIYIHIYVNLYTYSIYIQYIHTVILFWVGTVLVWCWSSSGLCTRWQLQWPQIKLNHNFTLTLRIWLALNRHWSYSQNIFTQKYIKHDLFLLIYICFDNDTVLWLSIIIIFFMLIYIVYRRWRCLTFLRVYIYPIRIMLSIIINRFYLNALVRTYCYQFGLFTLSLLLFKISYYFSLNCHLNGHTGRKMT